MNQLVWFRADLRVHDNRALRSAWSRAKTSGGKVYAVFLISQTQWQGHNLGLPKRDFIARQLVELSTSLASHDIELVLLEAPRFDDAPAVLMKFAKENNISDAHWQVEFGWDERQRDKRVSTSLQNQGVELHVNQDRCLVNPDQVLTLSGTAYKVFSAFKKNWLSLLMSQWQAPKVKGESKTRSKQVRVPLQVDALYTGAESAEDCQHLQTLWPAGEEEAQRRLYQFLSESVRDYQLQRDFPAVEGTSSLSPYLAAGVIGPRQCVTAWLNEAQGDWFDPSMQTWLNELAWRDFYHYVMWHFPKVSKNLPFQDKTRAVQWRNAPEDFSLWCEGKTGVPIVDAAMAQLNQTGWMHNRLRMVVASYLTKNLFIDWRLGEAYFMQQLVDADFAANNGGWQWSASTGTDAAPYFRVFNPVSQSERFDPDGEFIRTWLPELSHLSGKLIHSPRASERRGYPAPLVDLKVTRRLAIEAFASL
ncbi:deoxyribodipyrimidine photo-lyase [Simiduia litorea]|uniref:cryptochrome/photolyase family protein n=1 Tax=Simiduia litorea TaxID=1435348 RepID=UPI0036F20A1E